MITPTRTTLAAAAVAVVSLGAVACSSPSEPATAAERADACRDMLSDGWSRLVMAGDKTRPLAIRAELGTPSGAERDEDVITVTLDCDVSSAANQQGFENEIMLLAGRHYARSIGPDFAGETARCQSAARVMVDGISIPTADGSGWQQFLVDFDTWSPQIRLVQMSIEEAISEWDVAPSRLAWHDHDLKDQPISVVMVGLDCLSMVRSMARDKGLPESWDAWLHDAVAVSAATRLGGGLLAGDTDAETDRWEGLPPLDLDERVKELLGASKAVLDANPDLIHPLRDPSRDVRRERWFETFITDS